MYDVSNQKAWPPNEKDTREVYYSGRDIANGVCRCCFGLTHLSAACPWLAAWYQQKLELRGVDPTMRMPKNALDLASQVYGVLLDLRANGLSNRASIRYGVLLMCGYDLPEHERCDIVGGTRPPRLWEVEDNEMECEEPHGYFMPGVCDTPPDPVPIIDDIAMCYCDHDGNVMSYMPADTEFLS